MMHHTEQRDQTVGIDMKVDLTVVDADAVIEKDIVVGVVDTVVAAAAVDVGTAVAAVPSVVVAAAVHASMKFENRMLPSTRKPSSAESGANHSPIVDGLF